MSIHNKKRNTGLLYEFLIKTISQSLVDDDKKKSSKALKIVCHDIAVLEYRKAYNKHGMLWGEDLEL